MLFQSLMGGLGCCSVVDGRAGMLFQSLMGGLGCCSSR